MKRAVILCLLILIASVLLVNSDTDEEEPSSGTDKEENVFEDNTKFDGDNGGEINADEGYADDDEDEEASLKCLGNRFTNLCLTSL